MKIGINYSQYDHTYERYGKEKFLKLRQHGYDAVDYSLAYTGSQWYCANDEDLKQRANAEAQAANRAGIQISQTHGPWRWPPRDSSEQDREERLEKMKKAAVVTALLGCENMVIHPIMPFGIEDLKCDKQQETWDLNLAFFRPLVAFAKQYGVTVCLENMPMRHFSIATPEKILAFVKEINDDHFKICLDTGHVSVFPDLSVGNEIRKLGDYIRVLHIHDNMGDKDAHLYPSKGIIDWCDFVNALNEIGYDGVLSLETSPSGNLEDEAFEKESIHLCKMFKDLVTVNQKRDI